MLATEEDMIPGLGSVSLKGSDLLLEGRVREVRGWWRLGGAAGFLVPVQVARR